MKNIIYRFSVNGETVNPIYKDDLTIDKELEQGEAFFRPALSANLTFVRKDYLYLASQAFDTVFNFLIEISYDLGVSWSSYFVGKFMKTDCTWDADEQSCQVKPEVNDNYNLVIARQEKEYDLIKLTPEIVPLNLQRRPLIQVYIPGDTVISCFIGGTYWEQDANATTSSGDLINKFKFAVNSRYKEIKVTGSTVAGVNGTYYGTLTDDSDKFSGALSIKNALKGQLRSATNPDYWIEYNQADSVYFYGGDPHARQDINIKRVSDNVTIYNHTEIPSPKDYSLEQDTDAAPKNGTPGENISLSLFQYDIYARYLVDKEEVAGVATSEIPSDDITDDNRNYSRVVGYAVNVIYVSANLQTDPTEYGVNDDGLYYAPPTSLTGTNFFPVAKSTWINTSYWFAFSDFDWLLEEQGRSPHVLNDTYPLASAIKVLLNEIDPTITHEETTDYSEFMYNFTNNPIGTAAMRILLSQKTNVINGNYDKPAQKATTKLKDIFDMLKSVFKVYWFIDDNKRLRLEHLVYFRNGGSYSGTARIGYDLTGMENTRNHKKWSYKTSAWSFDKEDMPATFQFSWMDDVTPSFEGLPIEIISPYVKEDNIEDVQVGNFTTDIDFMMLNPGSISDDGFALLGAVEANGLEAPDSYFGQQITNGQSKAYAIKSTMQGKAATLEINVQSVNTAGTATVIFFDKDNNIVGTLNGSISISAAGQYSVPASIPTGAVSLVLSFSEDMYTYINDLNIAGTWELPFVTRTVNGSDYIMQNGYLSWTYIHPNYYMFDLPARLANINGQQMYALGIDRKKKQTLKFPSLTDPDTNELIRTAIGDGQIEKLSINLHSRMNSITLKYDTE